MLTKVLSFTIKIKLVNDVGRHQDTEEKILVSLYNILVIEELNR